MKIIFYINTICRGGAERVMCNLATAFSEHGNDCILVTSFANSDEYQYGEKVKRISLFEKRFDNIVKRNVLLIKKLRTVLKDEKPDVLISFMAEPNFRVIIASMGLPVKTLISVRNDPNIEYAGLLGKIVGKVVLPMADGCVFQTADAQKWFPKRLQKKSRIIYNPVNEEFYSVQRKPIRGEIVTCGRLEQQKNHALLLDAFAQVVERCPFATLKIYGEGSLHNQLQLQIENLSLQENAFLMGATDNVPKVLETADLFVLSSDYEGMPNALMEAMAAAVPCISTDCPCGGPRMLLTCYENLCLFPVSNCKQLSSNIVQVLNDSVLRLEIVEFMKQKSKAFYPSRVYKEWEEYIFDIMQMN